MGAFDNLLQAGRIGKMELKNRIVMAPMGSNFAESDGTCGERIQAYYEARAAGGVGLITMGVGAIAYPHGTAEPYQVGLSDDKFIPGLKGIVDRVHKHGAKISIQLQHAGKTSVRDLAEGRELPDKTLVAGVPISLRAEGDTSSNNQVSGTVIDLARADMPWLISDARLARRVRTAAEQRFLGHMH